MEIIEESKVFAIYEGLVEILKKEEYQYFYKVNSESETEYRHYKYNSNFDIEVDEWNKIWIGYRFLLPQDFITY